MRLILDAHVSGPVVGEALEREGHDVFAVDQRLDLEGLSDKDIRHEASTGVGNEATNIGQRMCEVCVECAFEGFEELTVGGDDDCF